MGFNPDNIELHTDLIFPVISFYELSNEQLSVIEGMAHTMGAYIHDVGRGTMLLTMATELELSAALLVNVEIATNSEAADNVKCECHYCNPTDAAMIEVLDRNGNTIQTLH